MSFSKSSNSKSIANMKTHELEAIENLDVKRFFLSQRPIQELGIFNVNHAFLVLELENEALITLEVTGTSVQDIFVNVCPGGEATSIFFVPKFANLKLKQIIEFSNSWKENKQYHLKDNNCYHFTHAVLETFAAGDVSIVMDKHREEWLLKIYALFFLAVLYFGYKYKDLDMVKKGLIGLALGLAARYRTRSDISELVSLIFKIANCIS